jgi:hypothetical protein
MQWEVQNVILKSVKNDGSQYHAKGTVYWAVFLSFFLQASHVP